MGGLSLPPAAAEFAAASAPALCELPASREIRVNAARISVSIADCRVTGSSSRCLQVVFNFTGMVSEGWSGGAGERGGVHGNPSLRDRRLEICLPGNNHDIL